MGPLKSARWTFTDNRLATYEFESGEEGFREAFDRAGPGKDRPGFFSIGLNPRIREVPGLEDFERGAVLLGVGGNVGYGGKTRLPFHSWVSLGGGHIEIDGKTIVADGEIL